MGYGNRAPDRRYKQRWAVGYSSRRSAATPASVATT